MGYCFMNAKLVRIFRDAVSIGGNPALMGRRLESTEGSPGLFDGRLTEAGATLVSKK